MSWLSSLKEKSLKIAQLYKNELSEFMSNLNDDIKGIGKPELNTEENMITPQTDSRKESCGQTNEILVSESSSISFLSMLQSLILQKITDEELEAKISIVLSNPEEYLQADPINLLLFHREDFTCFQAFVKLDILTYDICQEIITSNMQLSFLFQSISEPEATKILLSRFIYSLIYLLENSPQEKAGDLEIDETPGKDAFIENQGDALEKNSQTSDQYIVIEDGSSSSNHSNETDKIESIGQRDANNLSESDDWHLDEMSFSLELSN